MNRQQYQQALQQVARRRQAAEAAALRRRDELYAAAPHLAELDEAIARESAAAVRLAAGAQQREAGEKRAEVQRLRDEKRQLLKDLGVPGGKLEPAYHCKKCHDTGIHNGTACACVHEEMKKQRREAINQSGPFGGSSFDNFRLGYYPERLEGEGGATVRPRDAMAGILRDCADWAAEFGPRSQSLYMFGYAGLGKTHLALATARKVLEAGWDVIYVSAQQAFDTLANGEDGGELYGSMLGADLLVLDDLGTEYLNAFTRSRLYQLVNSRMGRRPTIYTSNICSQELLNQRYDEKIASRLLGDCHLMRFWGEDIRLLKKRG